MKKTLKQIILYMAEVYFRDISIYDESFLKKSILKRMSARSVASPELYLKYLDNNPSEADTFFDSLTIAYSEFFRNPLTFAIIEVIILPALLEHMKKISSSEIRVWSAGCAAGQEAYSVAILLKELAKSRGENISFRIFATDPHERELVSARRGIYEAREVQNLRIKHSLAYFSRNGDCYKIAQCLREGIDFSVHDLLDEHSSCPSASIYGNFDLIICSNVLYYYRPEIRRFILEKLRASISSEGYFVTGEAERAIVEETKGFRAVAPLLAVFQKIGKGI